MTVFIQDLENALTIQPDEVGSKYLFRYFACGVEGWKRFVAKLPSNWAIHSFSAAQGMPAVLFSINNEG